MLPSVLVAAFGALSLAAAAPTLESNASLEARQGPFGNNCKTTATGTTVTFSKEETGWAFPVAGTGCNAGSTSKYVLGNSKFLH